MKLINYQYTEIKLQKGEKTHTIKFREDLDKKFLELTIKIVLDPIRYIIYMLLYLIHLLQFGNSWEQKSLVKKKIYGMLLNEYRPKDIRDYKKLIKEFPEIPDILLEDLEIKKKDK